MTTPVGTSSPGPRLGGSAETAPSVLQRLGTHIASLSYADLTDAGLNLVSVAVVDTLGVTLAGSTAESTRAVRSLVHSNAASHIVGGDPDGVSAEDAGLVNGVAAHALDYDDGNLVIVGHPSVVLVPAVLALGEELDSSCQDAAVGYAAGYEAMIRLAHGINPGHYSKGWHPTSTLGVFGAAGAAARMLGLTGEQTTVALALAASMASGVKANFGTMAKALHIGHAIRDGLLCARLAAIGYTANPYALEALQGFFTVYGGAGSAEVAAIFHDDLAGFEVNREFNPIKGYPCCHSTHSAVDAARELRGQGVTADDVDTITVTVDAQRMPHTDRPVLTEALSGKFSLQYVVARALLDGTVGLADFDGEAHRDPAALALMARTQVVAAEGPSTNSFAATLTIATRDGSRHHASRDPMTEGVDYHAHPPLLWDKFRDCARSVLPADRVNALTDALRSFPDKGTVRELLGLTVGDPHPAATAGQP